MRRPRVNERLSRLERKVDKLIEGSSESGAPRDGFDALAEQVERLAKTAAALLGMVAGATGFFYAIGYVIVNSYFLSYGIRLFNLSHPSYLVSGIVFLVFNLIVIVLPLTIRSYWTRFSETFVETGRHQQRWRWRLLLFISSLSVAVILHWMLLDLIGGEQLPDGRIIGSMKGDAHLLFSLMTIMALLSLTDSRAGTENASDILVSSPRLAPSHVIELIFALILVLVTWTEDIYPGILPAFGGGQPVTVQLVLKSDEGNGTAPSLSRVAGLSVEEGVTEPVGLLDESSSTLLVVLENGSAARLNRNAIDHIIYLRDNDP